MDNVEYSLPYGWKKVGIKRKKKHKHSSQNWDFYIWSPCGKKFRSSCEIDEFLANNPKGQEILKENCGVFICPKHNEKITLISALKLNHCKKVFFS